jgi:hypothetical protein
MQSCYAELPKPIGGVSLLREPARADAGHDFPSSPWHLGNEDGFELASFFDSKLDKDSMPATITPGMEMTRAAAPPGKCPLQAIGKKLYVSTGDSAYWNLEVTGLDKVKALQGGKLTVPAAK